MIKMHLLYLSLALLVFAFVFTACEQRKDSEMLELASFDTMTVVDSIGIMVGDSNYVFGRVADIARGPQGEIFILDGIRNCVLVYSTSGDFLGQVGRGGEGPGEFDAPYELAVLSSGEICIVDNEEWCEYDSDWQYSNSFLKEQLNIMRMQSVGFSNILGIRNDLAFDDSGLHITRRVSLWDYQSPNDVLVDYYQLNFDANNPNEVYTIDNYHVTQYTEIDAVVYIAPESVLEPIIYSYDLPGSLIDSLCLPYPEIEKSETYLEQEKSFVEGSLYSLSSGEKSINWTPYPYRSMIGSLGSDSEGRLWVQRAFEDVVVFDVFDTENLDIVKSIVVPSLEGVMNWKFNISEHGIIAMPIYDYEYPIIYIIE